MTHGATSNGRNLPSPATHESVVVFKSDGNAPENIQISSVKAPYSEGIIGLLLRRSLKTVNSDFINAFSIAENFMGNSSAAARIKILQTMAEIQETANHCQQKPRKDAECFEEFCSHGGRWSKP